MCKLFNDRGCWIHRLLLTKILYQELFIIITFKQILKIFRFALQRSFTQLYIFFIDFIQKMDSADLIEFYYEQINNLRKKPVSIQPLLKDRLTRLVKQQDKEKQINCYSHYQFGNIMFKTIEGQKGIKDALLFVQQQPRRKTLVLSQKLCEIAYQIGLQMQKSSTQIDLTVYREPFKKLLQSYMPQVRQRVQIIVEYGFRKDIDLLTNIVIDDGNYEKTRRLTLFSDQWESIGISVHEHYEFDFFTVFLFSNYQQPIKNCECQII